MTEVSRISLAADTSSIKTAEKDLDAFGAAGKGVEKNLDATSAAFTRAGKAAQEAAKGVKTLEGVAGGLITPTEKLQGQMEKLAKGARVWAGSFADLPANGGPLPTLNEHFDKVSKTSAKTGQSVAQVSNQLQDFFIQIQSGQNPLTAFLQQGSQLYAVFGGIKPAIAAVTGLFTPLTTIAVAAAATLGGIAYAIYSGAEASSELRKSLAATGNAAAITEGQFNSLAQSVSESAKTTIGSSRDLLQGLVGSGRFTGEALVSAANAASALQKATGQGADDILQSFTNLTDGVSAGAEKLNSTFHFLTITQAAQIRALEEQGQKQKALTLTFDALTERVSASSREVGLLERAWTSAKNAISGYIDAAKGIGRASTIDDATKQAEAYLQTLRAAKATGSSGTSGGLTYADAFRVDSGQTTIDKLIAGQQAIVDRLKESKKLSEDVAKAQGEWARRTEAGIAFNKEVEASLTSQERLTKQIADANARADAAGLSKDDPKRLAVIDSIRQGSAAFRLAMSETLATIEQSAAAFEIRIRSNIDTLQSEAKRGMSGQVQTIEAVRDQELKLAAAQRSRLEAELEAAKMRRDSGDEQIRLIGEIRAADERAAAIRKKAANDVAEALYNQARAANAVYAAQREEDAQARAAFDASNDAARKSGAQSVYEYGRALREQNRLLSGELEIMARYGPLSGNNARARQIEIGQLRNQIELEKQLAAIDANTGFGPEEREQQKTLARSHKGIADANVVKQADIDALKRIDEFLDPTKADDFGAALSKAFGAAGNSLATLTKGIQEYAKGQRQINAMQADLQKVSGLTPEQKLERQIALQQKQAELQIESYANIAGAAKGFFNEGTRGYKALEAAETAFRVAQIASNLAQGVSAAAVGIANQAKGDPYSAFARMAVMAAAMASLGFATGFFGTSGGGDVPTSKDRQSGAATGTAVTKAQLDVGGTVLGDISAKSESIANSIKNLEDKASIELPLTSEMLDALHSIDAGIAGLGSLIARGSSNLTTGSGLGIKTGVLSVNSSDPVARSIGLGGVAKELEFPWMRGIIDTLQSWWGKTKQDITDTGLSLSGTLAQLASGQGVQQYADVATTTSSWFGLKKETTNSTVFGAVDEDISKQFSLIFQSVGDSIVAAAKAFGQSDDSLAKMVADYVVDIPRLSLKDLNGEELQTAITSAIGSFSDTLAKAALPGIGDFQRIGEGYFETLTRVASGIEVAKYQLEQLGISAISYTDITRKQGDVTEEIVRQSIVAAETIEGTMTNVGTLVSTFSGSSKELAQLYGQLLSVKEAMGAVGISTELLDVTLIRHSGGLDKLSDALATYGDKFFSDQEKLARQTSQLGEEFAKVGQQLPTTRDGFRELIGTLSDSGSGALGAILSLADAFNQMITASDSLAKAERERLATISNKSLDLQIELLKAQGDAQGALALERRREIDQLAELERSLNVAAGTFTNLQTSIYAAADAATAAAEAADAAAKAQAASTRSHWADAAARYQTAMTDSRWFSETTKSYLNDLKTEGSAIWNYIQERGYSTSEFDIPGGWTVAGDMAIPGAQASALQNWYLMQKAAEAQKPPEGTSTNAQNLQWSGIAGTAVSPEEEGRGVDPLIREQNDVLKDLIRAMQDLDKSLSDFGRDLLFGASSTLSPEQQYFQSRDLFRSLVQTAKQTGDAEAIKEARDAGQIFIEKSQAYNATGSGGMFGADFSEVIMAVGDLRELLKKIESHASSQVIATIETSGGIESKLKTANDIALEALEAAAHGSQRNVG